MKVLLKDTNCEIEESIINIDSLEDVLELMNKYNSMLVIMPPWNNDNIDFEVEIYNGYRE